MDTQIIESPKQDQEKNYELFCYDETGLGPQPIVEIKVHTHVNVTGIWIESSYTAVDEDGQPIGLVFKTTARSDSMSILVNANCGCDACRGYPGDFDKVFVISSKL